MNSLDIDKINLLSPYSVVCIADRLHFRTDYGIDYIVTFDLDANPYFTAYWFNLSNPNGTKSPSDNKIQETVICIIEEFFRCNPEILLYMCSTSDGHQEQRARLFLRWFNSSRQQQRYYIKSTDVKGENDESEMNYKEYVALIVQRTHPQLDKIIQLFDEEIGMFNDVKP